MTRTYYKTARQNVPARCPLISIINQLLPWKISNHSTSAFLFLFSHTVLLSRIFEFLGLTGTALSGLYKYLLKLTHFVITGGSWSISSPVNHGVPQGRANGYRPQGPTPEDRSCTHCYWQLHHLTVPWSLQPGYHSRLHSFIPCSYQICHQIIFFPPNEHLLTLVITQWLCSRNPHPCLWISDKALDRLQYVQNTTARLLTCTKLWQQIAPTPINLLWLAVKSRIIYKILLLTYKSLNVLPPQYLFDLLHPHT